MSCTVQFHNQSLIYPKDKPLNIGRFGEYQMEFIDSCFLDTCRWITAAKLSKVALTGLALLTVGATIALISAAPILAIPMMALGFGALYVSAQIRDYDDPGAIDRYRMQALDPRTPLSSTISEHGWEKILDKKILSKAEINEMLSSETRMMNFLDIISTYSWDILTHRLIEAEDLSQRFHEETKGWTLRKIIQSFGWKVFDLGVADPLEYRELAENELDKLSIGQIRRVYGHHIFRSPLLSSAFVSGKVTTEVLQSPFQHIYRNLWSLIRAQRGLVSEELFAELSHLATQYEHVKTQHQKEKDEVLHDYHKQHQSLLEANLARSSIARIQRDLAINAAETQYTDMWSYLTEDDAFDFDELSEEDQDTLIQAEELREELQESARIECRHLESSIDSETAAQVSVLKSKRDSFLSKISASLSQSLCAIEAQWNSAQLSFQEANPSFA